MLCFVSCLAKTAVSSGHLPLYGLQLRVQYSRKPNSSTALTSDLEDSASNLNTVPRFPVSGLSRRIEIKQVRRVDVGAASFARYLSIRIGLQGAYAASCTVISRLPPPLPRPATSFASHVERFAFVIGPSLDDFFLLCSPGMATWAVAIPPDVIKSRWQTAAEGTYSGLGDVLRSVPN